MGVEWVMQVPSLVFTRVKSDFSKTIKTKYNMSDKNFSTVGSSGTPAVFPFVYIQFLPSPEIGRTLDGRTKNGGNFNFQIDVVDNKTQARAREVMTEVLRIMADMGFNSKEFPYFDDSEKDVHRMVARFDRLIGAGEYKKAITQ